MIGSDGEAPGGLTRGELAKRIGKSVATVRRLEGRGVLQPTKDTQGVHRFDPADVARAEAAVQSGPLDPQDDGEAAVRRGAVACDGNEVDGSLAAEVFGLLEDGFSPVEVVEQLGVSPTVVRRLMRDYQDLKQANDPPRSVDTTAFSRDVMRLQTEISQMREMLAPLLPLARELSGDLRCICGHQHSLGVVVACTACGMPGALRLG